MKCIVFCDLAPTTPKEADFDEIVPDVRKNSYEYLKPVIPGEASLDKTDDPEMIRSLDYLIKKWSLVTPTEADFNEPFDLIISKEQLPVTPLEADFYENF